MPLNTTIISWVVKSIENSWNILTQGFAWNLLSLKSYKSDCPAILGFEFHYLQNNKRHRANKTYVYSFCICLTRETSVYIVQNKTPDSFEVVGK